MLAQDSGPQADQQMGSDPPTDTTTVALTSPPASRRRWRFGLGFFAVCGPGLVVMLADTDASSLITAAQPGAQWGYRMILPTAFGAVLTPFLGPLAGKVLFGLGILGAVLVRTSLDLVTLEAKALPPQWQMRGWHKRTTWFLCLLVIVFSLYMIPKTLGNTL